MIMSVHLVSKTCCNQSLSHLLPVTYLKNYLQAPIPNMWSGQRLLYACVMCGIKSFDVSAVSQGMMLYNKIHKDITLRSQTERCVLGIYFSVARIVVSSFFNLPFYQLPPLTTPSHTDWLWLSWTGSRPTACQLTVKRQSQTSLQQ